MDVTVSPIFLPRAPDRNPRTECACQPVAFMSSFTVAPPERFSRSRTWAVLLPWRAPFAFFLGDWADFAPLVAFFAGLAFLPDLALDGATWAFCAAVPGFLAAFGCSAGAPASVLAVSAGIPFITLSPWAVITAIPWITRVRPDCKLILMGVHIGEGSAVEAIFSPRWGQVVADVRTWRKIRSQEGAGSCSAALSSNRGGGSPSGGDQP